MNLGVAKEFQIGVNLKRWLMVVLMWPKAEYYFHKLKGKCAVEDGVARTTLCHTLALPLPLNFMYAIKHTRVYGYWCCNSKFYLSVIGFAVKVALIV